MYCCPDSDRCLFFHILYLISYGLLEVIYMKEPILVLVEHHPTVPAFQIQTTYPIISTWLAKELHK